MVAGTGVGRALEQVREFTERNPALLVVGAVITVGSPLLGLVINGVRGVVVGLVLGVLADLVGARAVVRVREIRRAG